ncbi:hypothetical protein [Arthrobacter sp. S39]|uniref:hypothetical protein n=1 Tax=Arthrobacter sp. S39 TaxID=2509720 RepID=UPI0010375EE1|nr:hypothetical protein [Arthrobacter sp. S39]TAP45827.1 hypothetical protein EYS21_03755 [Arthrobacter sp. S39]
MQSTTPTPRSFELSSDALKVRVEDVGARISSIFHRQSGLELLALADWTGAPEADTDEDRKEEQWLRRFASGWHVLIPHAGEPLVVDGVAHPFHGEAPRRHWSIKSDGTDIQATVDLESVPLRLIRTTRIDASTVSVRQEVKNLVDAPVRFGWVEHPVLNGEFLSGQELRFGAASNHRRPVMPSQASGFSDIDGSDGRCVVALPLLRQTLELSWDASVLPHAYVWQERQHMAGSPWYGRVDGVGIEPASHPSGHPPVGLGPHILAPGRSLISIIRLKLTE